MLTLYKNIRDLRKQNHWSQEELASRMGYTDRSTIAKIESGKVDLPQSKIIEFAKVFGVDPGDLLGWDSPHADYIFPSNEKSVIAIKAENDPQLMEFVRLFLTTPEEDRPALLQILKRLQPKS